MNLFCALLGSGDDESTRALRVRDALRDEAATVLHPTLGASIGWCGTEAPADCATDGGGFVAVFGAGHAAPGLDGDTEVRIDVPAILARHLRARHAAGASPLAGLAGSFLAVGVDPVHGAFAGGDASGGRPPYVHVRGAELAVSNHPAACARLAGAGGIDRSYEDFLLIFGFLPEGRTVFTDVSALPPGQMLQADGDGWRRAAVVAAPAAAAYADVPQSEDQLLDRLYDVMLRCLREQLANADVVGIRELFAQAAQHHVVKAIE